MSDFSIRDILNKVQDGIIRIPTFQRGFVWDSDDIAFFMDSIYKGYPFGTIQLWRTSESLNTERAVGPFPLFPKDDQYPIDYVLDGQQRVTSIFGVFQTDHDPGEKNPFSIYFDLDADTNIQDSQFLALKEEEVDSKRHFPLNCLFDTVKYRESTSVFDETKIKTLDDLQATFKEAKIPYQTLETNDNAKVAIVFERINRKGVPLDTFQLLVAWTWSEDFVLQEKFKELQDELAPYGFEDVGTNNNLLLRICSAILSENASAESLISLNGSVVRDRFDEITNGVRGAIDFIKRNFKIEKLDNLPYDNLLIPLAVFFSSQGNQHLRYDNNQRDEIRKWFWKTSFSKRYSAGTIKALNRDIEEMIKLKNNNGSILSSIPISLTEDFFNRNQFMMGTVNTKTFILMLAQNNPRSFISGSPITLSDSLKQYNRNEFHHIYPRAFLRTQTTNSFPEGIFANFCFLSRVDNSTIGGDSPSVYRKKMPTHSNDILETSYIDETVLIGDNYDSFINNRSSKLLSAAQVLIN